MRTNPDILARLNNKCEQSSEGGVFLETDLLRAAIDGLDEAVSLEQQLADALSNTASLEQQLLEANELLSLKPTLAKKLNDKIKSLQAEIEVLRSDTKVNELERKVQRLEVELKQSYATKNFSLRDGLLEIEKNYRDFIHQSEDVEDLWSEVTALLSEDREGLPLVAQGRRMHMAQRRPPRSSTSGGKAVSPSDVMADSGSGQGGTVHDQVERYEEAGSGGAAMLPLPAGLVYADSGVHVPGAGAGSVRPPSLSPRGDQVDTLTPDARYFDAQEAGQYTAGTVGGMRSVYNTPMSAMPSTDMHHGDAAHRSQLPLPADGQAKDAWDLDHQLDLDHQSEVINSCVAQLRTLFSAAGATAPHGASSTPTRRLEDGWVTPRTPDTSAFYSKTQDLNSTLAALLKHYASHSAAEGHGHTAGGIPLRLTVSESLGRTRSDETHFSNPMFSTQVEDAKASIQQLKVLYQQRKKREGSGGIGRFREAGASGQEGAQDGQHGDGVTRPGGEPSLGGADGTGNSAAQTSLFDFQADRLAATIEALRTAFAAAAEGPLRGLQALVTTPPPSAASGSRATGPRSRLGTAAMKSATAAEFGREGDGPSLDDREEIVAPIESLFMKFMEQVGHQVPQKVSPQGEAAGKKRNTKKRKNKKAQILAVDGDAFVEPMGRGVSHPAVTPGDRIGASNDSAPVDKTGSTPTTAFVEPGGGTAPGPEPGSNPAGGMIAAPASDPASSKDPSDWLNEDVDPFLAKLRKKTPKKSSSEAGHGRTLESDSHVGGGGQTPTLGTAIEGRKEVTSAERPAEVVGSSLMASSPTSGGPDGPSPVSRTLGDNSQEEGADLDDDDDGEEEGEEEEGVRPGPSSSELAALFSQFLRGPAGLSGLPQAELQELLQAAAMHNHQTHPHPQPDGMLKAHLRWMQEKIEAKHATIILSSPEAAALWEEAKRVIGAASGGYLGISPQRSPLRGGVPGPASEAAGVGAGLGSVRSPDPSPTKRALSSEITPADEDDDDGGLHSMDSFIEREDEESVLTELRHLNMDYAIQLAERDEAMDHIKREQRAAAERFDTLQARLGSLATETAALREDNEVLTHLLVETKVLYAEQLNETMRLQQRLKRSLQAENTIRNANEDLMLKLQETDGLQEAPPAAVAGGPVPASTPASFSSSPGIPPPSIN